MFFFVFFAVASFWRSREGFGKRIQEQGRCDGKQGNFPSIIRLNCQETDGFFMS